MPPSAGLQRLHRPLGGAADTRQGANLSQAMSNSSAIHRFLRWLKQLSPFNICTLAPPKVERRRIVVKETSQKPAPDS